MDWSLKRLTSELKTHDPQLYAIKTSSGMKQVWRRAEKWSAADALEGDDLTGSSPTQFILALTADWTLRSTPCEWGIEPVMQKILEMDSWRDDSTLSKIRQERERKKEDRERIRRNERRAQALDLRRDFAKATNDINTASL